LTNTFNKQRASKKKKKNLFHNIVILNKEPKKRIFETNGCRNTGGTQLV